MGHPRVFPLPVPQSRAGAHRSSIRPRKLPSPARLLAVPLLLASACGPQAGDTPGAPRSAPEPPTAAAEPRPPLPLPDHPLFLDATESVGLDFVHWNGMTGAYYMPENIGATGALLDYDGDGDLDLYLVQGRLLGPGARLEDALTPPGEPHSPVPWTDRLYRNDLAPGPDGEPALRFTDVTAEAGLPEALYGMGAATGDFDNDGRVDLYVTAFGPNRLLRNLGDGRFEDVTAAAGVDDPRWSVPAVFFDSDGDGWLDLWVGSYLDFRFEDHRPCTTLTGAPDYCDPSVYGALPDRLFRSRGAGPEGTVTFEDVTAGSGLAAASGKALGVVVADLDGDGRLDLYVANDGTPNHLWIAEGGGTFRDDGLLSGAAVNAAGLSEASMGVDAGDHDGDGDLDLVIAHFAGETHTLYAADGTGGFEDVTAAAGLGPPSVEANGFGAGWLDFDHDGLLDLLVVNGAVRALEEQVRSGDPYPFGQPNQLFRNAGGGRLEEVTDRAGPAFQASDVSRGALFGDLDQDGDIDVVVTNSNGPARVLLNAVGQNRPWLGVRAVVRTPTGAVRDAQGALVGLLRPGRRPLWRRAGTDGSYASGGDPRVVFGLGQGGADRGPAPETVRIVWPDGTSEDWDAPQPGRYTTLERGTGRPIR